MGEEAAPERIAIIWSPEARTDLRAIDREAALQILYCIDRYLASRTGDVKKLKPPLTGFRRRFGDYRVSSILRTTSRSRSRPSAIARTLIAKGWFPRRVLCPVNSSVGRETDRPFTLIPLILGTELGDKR